MIVARVSLSKSMLQKGMAKECETKSDCATDPDYPNGILVRHLAGYSLFYVIRGTSTMSQHSVQVKLRSWCPLRRLPLTPQHRQSSLEWRRNRSSFLPLRLAPEMKLFSILKQMHVESVYRGVNISDPNHHFISERHTTCFPRRDGVRCDLLRQQVSYLYSVQL